MAGGWTYPHREDSPGLPPSSRSVPRIPKTNKGLKGPRGQGRGRRSRRSSFATVPHAQVALGLAVVLISWTVEFKCMLFDSDSD